MKPPLQYKSKSDLAKELEDRFSQRNSLHQSISDSYGDFIAIFNEECEDFYLKDSPLLSLIKSDGENNNPLALVLDKRTIEDFIANPDKNVHPKTLDFLCVSLGYYGWRNFEKGESSINLNGHPTVEEFTQSVEEITTPLPHTSLNSDISGATIIDDNFVLMLEPEKPFSKLDFYTARQSGNCQWTGVLKKLDVERNVYQDLKETIEGSFKSERDFKVSAVVLGNGGSGKSTLLRRLALDLYKDKSFNVLWLNKGALKEFVEKGIKTIQNNSAENYLLIIEDWYRNVGDDTQFARTLLEITTDIPNIRICIGDRKTAEQVYFDYMSDQDAVFNLTAEENKHIIEKIIENYPEWRASADSLLENQTEHTFSLFLLLFIIANIQNSEHESKQDMKEPLTVFRAIIKSDIKKLAENEHYKGLAKALYYAAFIYNEYRQPINYKTLLYFADYFQGDKTISENFSNSTLSGNQALDTVWKYISVKDHRGSGHIYLPDEEWVHFNHDIFIEEGLTKIKFPQWENYGEFIRLQLVKLIIKENLWLDEMVLMDKIINDRSFVQKYKNEFLPYLEPLYDMNIFLWDDIIRELLKNAELSGDELKEHTLKILKCYHEEYIHFTIDKEEEWLQFVEYYKEKYNQIGKELIHHYISEYLEKHVEKSSFQHQEFDHFCFFHCFIPSEQLLDLLYDKILSHERVIELNSSIVKTVMRGSANQELVNKLANTILIQSDAHLLNLNFVIPAVEYADNEIVEKFAETVFTSNLKDAKERLLAELINKTKNEKYLQLFIDRFLFNKDYSDEDGLIDYDLSDFDDEIRESILQTIICHDSWDKLIPEIVMFAFEESKSDEDKRSFCDKVLTNNKWMDENPEWLFPLYQFSGHQDIKNCLLVNWQKVQVHEIFEILKSYSDKPLPPNIKKYIQEVIQDYHQTGNYPFHYGDLFLLDFSDSVECKNEQEKICSIWERKRESFDTYNLHVITKFLCSDYTSFFYKAKIARSIFSAWQEEIKSHNILDRNIRLYNFSHIPYIDKKEDNSREIGSECSYYTVYCKRYLFELCLLHPDMREEAKEILDLIEKETEEEFLPLSLQSIIKNFHESSWCENLWNDMKSRIINHTGYDDRGHDYLELLYS
ncbi:P-loop NTPase [Chryseobacterium oryctis]|uniref:Novel STAND NTPase 5 domain-containing protein n=1 Tax=Chryseobacterium oryctis TaxID=2952618 RepID=A0ABT3HIU6_9FLAO|nr:hypothetical protein [Chryseobacterium oryctis]MCW3159686.1 hypothetical protein [Chryseobacterium oryctis]